MAFRLAGMDARRWDWTGGLRTEHTCGTRGHVRRNVSPSCSMRQHNAKDIGTAVTSAPVAPSERIASLDILRGVAILGILLMNIQGFSMISASYTNPASYGDLTGANAWVWIVSLIVADQKFLTIFSLLFGAGIILITRRAEAKGQSALRLHYRRTGWLLVIGLIHAYVFWSGDILVTYALCGFLVVLLRHRSPKTLLILGLLTISVASIFYLSFGFSLPAWPPDAVQEAMQSWKPDTENVAREVAAYQGGWLAQMSHRVPEAFQFQTFLFLLLFSWRAGGLMLIGMALFKWGVLTAERSARCYTFFIVAGFGLGLPLVIYGIFRNFAADWSLEFSMFFGYQYNYWGSLGIALAYIGIVMLLSKSSGWVRLLRPFAAAGRMALTNYLLQTLICTTLFYGHGFGLFGQIERTGQLLIVISIWLAQLIISPLWLRTYRFGPAEWLWRTLTYQTLQPMRK